MDVLVGELLALSRLEAGAIGALEEEVNLGELVADIVDDARFEAEAVGKHVELDEHGSVSVRGNAELLHRSIENVIRNAVKHTAADSAVHVSIASGGEQAEIGIRDHGPGVAEHELDAIFAPFFRGSGHGDDGHGLGLAIAKRTIEAHGGHIRASNVAQGGLHVDIFLPAGTKH
jgi:two-component system OmpR family sensor kinase